MEMSEQSIIAKQETLNPTPKVSERDPNTPDLGHVNIRPFTPLYEHFGLEDDRKHDKNLEKIWEWAKNITGSENKDLIQLELIKLSNKLGTAALGEMPYAKVLNWITVSKQLNETAQILKGMER